MLRRCVHSARQIKKLNFLRHRQARPDPATTPRAVAAAAAAAELPWNRVARDVVPLKNGWTPPPEAANPALPFSLRRSPTGFLPVYSKVRRNKPHMTIVRGVRGDLDEFEAGLAGVAPGADVIRRLGAVEVRGAGHRTKDVRDWLTGLGL